MSIVVALTVFALILPAELPDKTMVATLVLSTRFPAFPVWVGVTAGFAVQTVVAVAAGDLVSLLPKDIVHGVTAAMFAIGALLMLRAGGGDTVEEEERELSADIAETPAGPSFRRAALTSFGVLFAAEWGDLSQILTANFAAKYADPIAVFLGAWLALAAVAAIAVLSGRALLRVVPLVWVRRLAALLFAVMAVVTGLEAGGVF
ncbi:MAG: Ca2+/H+ antiporter, family [Frankiaceae bacterium]|nr:Ca2+/H+ antiporter, family [Frankiaceae bacterium]